MVLFAFFAFLLLRCVCFCDSDNHLPNSVALVRNPCCILFDGVQYGGREVWDQRRGCDEVIFLL